MLSKDLVPNIHLANDRVTSDLFLQAHGMCNEPNHVPEGSFMDIGDMNIVLSTLHYNGFGSLIMCFKALIGYVNGAFHLIKMELLFSSNSLWVFGFFKAAPAIEIHHRFVLQ